MAEDPSILPVVSEGIKRVSGGMFAFLAIRAQGNQDRLNLQADIDAARTLRGNNPDLKRFSGLVSDIEFFSQHGEEVERQAINLGSTLLRADALTDWSKVDRNGLNPEFRHRFASEVINVSDETLQDLWARLLGGELESPGSVSHDTMSVVRDMTKDVAEEFRTLCSMALCDPYGGPIFVPDQFTPTVVLLKEWGLSLSTPMRLTHHRLTVNGTTTGAGDVHPDMHTYYGEFVVSHEGIRWRINRTIGPDQGIVFSPAGRELGRVVAPDSAIRGRMLNAMRGMKDWEVVPEPA